VPTRLPHIVVEIGRFMVTGGLSTLVSFTLFNFLVHGLYLTSDPWLGAQPLLALVVANLAGMMVSYQLSRSWAFRHRPPVHPDGGRTAFFLINLITLPLAVGTLWFSRHVLGLTDPLADNVAGNVVGALIGQVARFYLFRRYVFRQPVTASDMAHHPVSLLGPAHRLIDPDLTSDTP
jgi:putative flippase GtrA